MSFQLCAESIARIQCNRPPLVPSKAAHFGSYRDDYTGSEERPGRRFRVLVAPSNVHIVEKDVGDTGWLSFSCILTPFGVSRPRLRRKEEADRKWKGTASIIAPSPVRKGWFLSGEAQRIIAEIAERETAEQRRHKTGDAIGSRRITHLVGDVEDVGPRPVASIKRFDASAFCRKRLEQLFDSKTRGDVHDLAEAFAWQAKGLSVREIAVEMGRTQGWVRWRLDAISKLFIRHGIRNLSLYPQQETETVAH